MDCWPASNQAPNPKPKTPRSKSYTLNQVGPDLLPNLTPDSKPYTLNQVGLGLLLKSDEQHKVFVKECIRGFAAEVQGQIQTGDVIVAIDGRGVEGWDLDAIKQMTFGDEGTR